LSHFSDFFFTIIQLLDIIFLDELFRPILNGGKTMDRVTLKTKAKEQIKGNIGVLFVITLLVGLIAGGANAIPVVGSIASVFVVTPAFSLAVVMIYLNMTAGMKPEIGDLFSQFSSFWDSFKVTFLVGLFTALWSLLFVIPGIVKAFSYSQAMYIMAENPGIGALEAINRSKAMMDGHKMEYFVLQLSFIGWHLLGTFTFGIAYIWIVPYISATAANFYNSIKTPVENV
jgi:uncharacterized membrane protein